MENKSLEKYDLFVNGDIITDGCAFLANDRSYASLYTGVSSGKIDINNCVILHGDIEIDLLAIANKRVACSGRIISKRKKTNPDGKDQAPSQEGIQ